MGHTSRFIASVAVAAALLPATGRAADDLAELRAEIAALKAEYAARVTALEARIDQLESASPAAATVATAEPPAPPSSTPSRTSSAFNPAIAAILTGNYGDLAQDPADYHFAGFMPSGGEIGPGERSFNPGESEITLSASVDPYFTASLTAALSSEGEIGVEEAFFRTSSLPAGFTVKGGRFFSGVGYLNEMHAHAWDFVDQPLAYQAFFGGQYAQDGAQVKWLAPMDIFLEFGAETGNGGGFPGTRLGRNGLNGTTLFAHTGGDLGDSIGWRAGVSWMDLDAEDRTYEDVDSVGRPVVNAFTGSSRTWIADATFKWTPTADTRRRELKLQAEYLQRTEEGDLGFDTDGAGESGSYRSRQSGWYVQGTYRFMPRWRVGLRYDELDAGSTRIGLVQQGELAAGDFPLLLPASPSRVTTMIDWSPSEFSRLRAQYAWDDARDAATDRQLLIQYIYAIGAHGAHKF
ncbi:MAG: TonB-dependent receptor [Steroidobacteraceae bacterium]